MNAKPFTSDLVICDRDILVFANCTYRIRIKPFERGLLDIRVTLLDSCGNQTSLEWNTRAKDEQEAINTAVWNCLGEIDIQGVQADLPQFREFDWDRFESQR